MGVRRPTQERVAMPFRAFKALYENGKYGELLNQFAHMETQGKLASLTEEDQVRCIYYRSRSLEGLWQYEEALQVALTARAQFRSSDDKILSLMLLITQLGALFGLRRFEESQKIFKEVKAIIEALTAKEQQTGAVWIALFESIKGNIYWAKDEWDTALEHHHRSLALHKEIGNSYDIGISLDRIGFIHFSIDDWNTALDHYQQSLEIFEAIDNSYRVAWELYMIGSVYRRKGELETALDYWQRSFALFETLGNDIDTAYPLSSIIILLCSELQDHTQARKYLPQLQKLHERIPNKAIRQQTHLAEALVLKQSKRMADKAKAQNILQELLNEKNLFFIWERFAIIHLCELLLIEVKAFGDPEVWKEAKTRIHQLYDWVQDNHLFSMIGEALLLRAKVAAIDGDLQQALKYYEQARFMAEEKKIGLLSQKVDTEQKHFEAEFEKWQTLIQRNASLQERLTQSQIEDYMQQVQKMVTGKKD
ncbi:MAG: tetratricopeptide repeat protein [Candidatus Hodarchaeota archaeon]